MVYQENGKQPEHDVLAMAFINRQKWREIYKYDCAFMRGTIFAELDKPWLGRRGGGKCE